MRVKDWHDNRERSNMLSLIYEDMIKVSLPLHNNLIITIF